MRIGLGGGSNSVERAVEQAVEAEAAGFTSLWYSSVTGGDPLVQMALAGRATERIELGTAVLQTYTCHPQLQARRFRAASDAAARPLTLGVGPSHQGAIEQLGFSYQGVGRHTEEYVLELAELLAGSVPLLVGALGPRLLRVAGQVADGTVLWMANARAVATHVVPHITRAAGAAGRAAPRVVAGLPVAVHDDVEEAREAAAGQFAVYGTLPNYQRILAHGGIASPAEAALVGGEDAVAAEITALFDAGATDVWAAPFPVGPDRAASRARTRALLAELART